MPCNALYFAENPTIQRNISSPSSGSTSKPSKKPAEAGDKFSSKLHGVTTQKTVFFILEAMENSTLEFWVLFDKNTEIYKATICW
jgi:hypothetical protein